VWKNNLENNNEWIAEWNARARKVCEKKIHTKIVTAK
jgi:hypothetical protein